MDKTPVWSDMVSDTTVGTTSTTATIKPTGYDKTALLKDNDCLQECKARSQCNG